MYIHRPLTISPVTTLTARYTNSPTRLVGVFRMWCQWVVDLFDYHIINYSNSLLFLYFSATSSLLSVQFLKTFLILVFWGRGDFFITYIDGVCKVVLFGFISTHNHIFYTFVVMRRVYTQRGDRPILPNGNRREPRGVPCGRVAHLRGTAEERWNGRRSCRLCFILVFASSSYGYKAIGFVKIYGKTNFRNL